MPIRNWKPALSRFIIEFGDRLDGTFNGVGSYTELFTGSALTIR